MPRYGWPLVLILLLCAQVFYYNNTRLTLDNLQGVAVGGHLPSMRVQPLSGAPTTLVDLVTSTESCSLIVFAAVSCGICDRMRYTWKDQLAAFEVAVGADIQAFWLFGSGKSEIEKFTSGFDFGTINVLQVEDMVKAVRKFGVFGTPLMYLVDASGQVHGGVAGDYFPPIEVARAACT